MAIITKVFDKYRVTLPAKAREKFKITLGDPIEVIIKPEYLILKPKKMIDSSQAYFWTEEWQKKEKEVDRDYKEGMFKEALGVEEFFAKLESQNED